MRAILIHGDGDYSANEFESEHGGTPVIDIINNPDQFKSEEELWEIDVIEVGEVSPLFVEFIRRHVEDYDYSKHRTFYLENENIRN
jgi:hypothetical protein